MAIKYAILGLLSWKPFTGYELKKVISDSAIMYWSGNSNQIYKSLIQLLDEGLVTNEVQYQENSPMKKIYTVTEKGIGELKEWVQSIPDLPEFKNTFLIQLAWADQLKNEELSLLLNKYEHEIQMQLLMQQEKARRGKDIPNRTEREKFLWEMITENIVGSYQKELDWIKHLRQELQSRFQEVFEMGYWVKESQQQKYIESIPGKRMITSVDDALDFVAICGEHETNRLLLHEANLSQDFFNLKTGLAGSILQKFVNYQMKVAAIISPEQVGQGRFKEMALETNRSSNQFRIFQDHLSAEKWLVGN